MTDLDRATEYAAAAEAWRAFCAKRGEDTAGEPVAVVLLVGLCEPDLFATFTGDLLCDVLGGLAAFVRRVEADAGQGGGGGIFLHAPAIEAWRRRIDAAVTLRRYERAHREHLTRKLAGGAS